MNEKEVTVPNLLEESGVEKMILIIRYKHELLDRDLAVLYGVNQAVKRSMEMLSAVLRTQTAPIIAVIKTSK
ncbi:hypothetical protein [Fibrobacter sp. UWB12]|uniref:hypothetical protein n=1 Tax=Fibrobacter sp. UWB12 TaxID=1896203 RepID=UPI000914BBFF|nr:hypothetical protein [Fibrobacter sp. UWB12]SHK20007.1 hypothetical protein SAMN05720759_10172 [Fibrobacter sp. UWB12]